MQFENASKRTLRVQGSLLNYHQRHGPHGSSFKIIEDQLSDCAKLCTDILTQERNRICRCRSCWPEIPGVRSQLPDQRHRPTHRRTRGSHTVWRLKENQKHKARIVDGEHLAMKGYAMLLLIHKIRWAILANWYEPGRAQCNDRAWQGPDQQSGSKKDHAWEIAQRSLKQSHHPERPQLHHHV